MYRCFFIMKKYLKIFTCLFLVFVICINTFTVAYCSEVIDPGSNIVAEDYEKYGIGKSWDELTGEQKWNRMITNCGRSISDGIQDIFGVLKVAPIWSNYSWSDLKADSDARNAKTLAIDQGYTTPTELYFNENGMGWVYEKFYGKDFDSNVDEDMPDTLTVNPDVLNQLQAFINDINAESTGTKVVFTRTPTSNLWRDSGLPILLYQHTMSEWLEKYNGLVWYTFDNYNGYTWINWLDGDLNDYIFYDVYDINKDGYPAAKVSARRKDGGVIHYWRMRTVIPNGSPNDASNLQFALNNYEPEAMQLKESNGVTLDLGTASLVNDPNSIFGGSICTASGKLNIYKNQDTAISEGSCGYGIIPPYIQSQDMVQEYDEPLTISVSELADFDYGQIYNTLLNIATREKFTSTEIQKKINDVMNGLYKQLESGQIEQEEYFDSILTDESGESLLSRILSHIRAIDVNLGLQTAENTAFYGALLALIEEFQVKLDGILAELGGIAAELGGIATELGLLVGDEVADDVGDLIGDGLDIGSQVGELMTKKFPLSIPWDIQLIVNSLASTPETPKFEIPLVIPSWGIDTSFTIDLSDFQLLSDVAKWFFDILYGLAITKLTIKILEVEIVHS